MLKLFALAATLFVLPVWAGDDFISEKEEKTSNNGDWCKSLEDFGKFYRDKKDPFVQRIEFYGRLNYQYGYSDINIQNFDFRGGGTDLRRLRFGANIEFLDDWKLAVGAKMTRGRQGASKMGYSEMDKLSLTYDFGKMWGFKDVSVGYGRMKYGLTGEGQESANEIKTVERSNLSNFFGRSRATGLKIRGSRWDIDWTLGVMAPEANDTWSQWEGGAVYYASANIDLGKKKRLILDFLYNSADRSVANQLYDYDWAASAAYYTRLGDWKLMVNGIYGETNDEEVYGVVVMPSYEIINNKLEFVARYQWANASSDVFTINRRNIRDTLNNQGVNLPGVQRRGDENHTIYAGLNYYLCDHYAKFMVGAEYETLTGSVADLEATTLWAAFRIHF